MAKKKKETVKEQPKTVNSQELQTLTAIFGEKSAKEIIKLK